MGDNEETYEGRTFAWRTCWDIVSCSSWVRIWVRTASPVLWETGADIEKVLGKWGKWEKWEPR